MTTSKKTQDEMAQSVQNSAIDERSNISYIVVMTIRHFDQNRKCKIIVDKKTSFQGANAIDCRKNAITYAVQLRIDSQTDGKLCKYHLDSPMEGKFKQMHNVTCMSIEVICKDSITGEEIIIHEGNLNNWSYDYFDNYVKEVELYKRYGYDTDGWIIMIGDGVSKFREILNFDMLEKLWTKSLFPLTSKKD